jgi:hypothetical protein
MAEEILGETDGVTEEAAETALPESDSLLTKEENSEEKSSDDEGSKEAADDQGKTDKKSEDGDANKDEGGAPDEYSDFSVPEGVVMDEAALGDLKGQLKDMGASQDQAQKIIDLQVKTNAKAYEAQVEAWQKTQSDWKEAAQNDEEYGKGDFEANMVIARRGMREVGGAPLAEALDKTGMGSHPEFIRAFYRMGKAIGEDSFSIGGTSGSSDKSQADRIFHKHQVAG